jgi:uncharacterized membrane protein YagU involved in acid resistance
MSEESQGGLPIRIIGGAIYGSIAYVVSFGAVVALFLQRARERGVEPPKLVRQLDAEEQFVQLLGWIFYNAHTVDVAASATAGTLAVETEAINFVSEPYVSDTTIFHAIPAALLFVAGYVVAMRTPHRLNFVTGALAGASVTIGYGALAYAGATAFEVSTRGVTYAPAMPDALFVAGIAYPAIAGGAAGALRGL